MLKNLLDRLMAPADTTPLADDDARTALTALMIRVAKADGRFDQDERRAIADILKARYDLDVDETAKLMEEAAALEATATDNIPLTRMIKDGIPHDDRLSVVEALWHVVLADDHRHEDENAHLRLIVSLIGISDQESGLARQRVAAARAKPTR